MSKMFDAFPDWATGGGLFSAMVDPPWGTDFSGADLDLLYFSEHGEKTPSRLVSQLSDSSGVVSGEKLRVLARLVLARFAVQWKHAFNVLKLEYNPINNYDMTESEDNVRAVSHHEENVVDRTEDAENSENVFGFNSTQSVGANSETGNLKTNDNAVKDYELTDSTERTLKRSGNIGVTTSQQLIESELSLWHWNFLTQVFQDVNSILTIPIYE